MNLAIAGVASLLLAVASTLLGVGLFLGSLLIIYLRGYLVPGTPTLTKRYFPDRVLRWFEKEPTPTPSSDVATIDPERVLLDARAVTPCENGTDLCLTDNFRSAWREQVRTKRERGNPTEEDLRNVLDASSERLTFEEYGNALLTRTDDAVVGQWPSPAARIADVAAAQPLGERYPDWVALTPAARACVLASLRIFVESCPECGGPVRVRQESVESCCRSYDVLLSACEECDADLFEMEWQEESPATDATDQPEHSPAIET